MSVFRKAAEFLGLVDDEAAEYPLDDGYLDDADYGADAPYSDHDAQAAGPRARGEVETNRPERSESASGAVTVTRSASRAEPAAVVVQGATITPRSTPTASPAVRAVPVSAPQNVHVCEPKSFNDAQEIGDRIKSGQPVIMNLQADDRELQRRLIDFASGVCYALSGTMSKVADHVFLLTPANVDVSDDDVERLSARGLYRSR
jgi:cell division inhibitor SepF